VQLQETVFDSSPTTSRIPLELKSTPWNGGLPATGLLDLSSLPLSALRCPSKSSSTSSVNRPPYLLRPRGIISAGSVNSPYPLPRPQWSVKAIDEDSVQTPFLPLSTPRPWNFQPCWSKESSLAVTLASKGIDNRTVIIQSGSCSRSRNAVVQFQLAKVVVRSGRIQIVTRRVLTASRSNVRYAKHRNSCYRLRLIHSFHLFFFSFRIQWSRSYSSSWSFRPSFHGTRSTFIIHQVPLFGILCFPSSPSSWFGFDFRRQRRRTRWSIDHRT